MRPASTTRIWSARRMVESRFRVFCNLGGGQQTALRLLRARFRTFPNVPNKIAIAYRLEREYVRTRIVGLETKYRLACFLRDCRASQHSKSWELLPFFGRPLRE